MTPRIHFGVDMPVSLSIKNIPDRIAETLRARATAHHRSLQGELMAILEAAASERAQSGSTMQPVPSGRAGQRVSSRGTVTIDQAMERLRKRCPEPIPDPQGAVAIVREMRDSRYGEAWLATGRHDVPGSTAGAAHSSAGLPTTKKAAERARRGRT